MTIRIEHLYKQFGEFQALNDINLTVPNGSLTALLGPSGCGKTTLLRIIAGLEQADAGKIYFDGEDVTDKHVRERKVGFMFQHYALFRHMNVFDNIAFGLQMLPAAQRPSKSEIADKVHELLKLVQLDWLAKAYPAQLSGGQRQRIALARALAAAPKLLLLDEPFGALDAKVRKELRQWLRDIQGELGITSILVTHDQEEALEMADEIVVMNHGKIEQSGGGNDLYCHPDNIFVTEFLGEVNAFEGVLENGELHIGAYREPYTHDAAQGQKVSVYVRPHDFDVADVETPVALPAEIIAVHAVGAVARLLAVSPHSAKPVQIWLPPAALRHNRFAAGQTVWLKPQQTTVFKLPELVDFVI